MHVEVLIPAKSGAAKINQPTDRCFWEDCADTCRFGGACLCGLGAVEACCLYTERNTHRVVAETILSSVLTWLVSSANYDFVASQDTLPAELSVPLT